MNALDDQLRKATIVVAALSPLEADRLLDQFPADQAQRIRQLMVALDDIDPQEEQRVLKEFFQGRQPAPQEASGPSPRKFGLVDRQGDSRPFVFLRDAEAEKLARALAHERPQTIALVLSHLPPEQAGAVLVRLDARQQADVVRRLVDLEETDPDVLYEVEQALASRLSQQINIQRRQTAGLQAVSGILRSAAPQVGATILDNLALHDHGLAERLGPDPVEFEDLAAADEESWDEIVRAAGAELVMLALIGAPPRMIERIVRRLTVEEAAFVRERLDHPGPTRLSDVEEARRQIAELARRLAIAGRCRLPAPRRRTWSAAA